MIIHYDKRNGKILHVSFGRVHTDEEKKAKVTFPDPELNQNLGEIILSKKAVEQFEKVNDNDQSVILKYKIGMNEKGNFTEFLPADSELQEEANSTETIIIDLKKSLEDIAAGFDKDTISYIKASKGLTFREIGFSDRELALKIIEEVEDKKDIDLSKQILTVRAPFLDGLRRLYLVEDDVGPLATVIIQVNLKRAIYKLASVNQRGRELHAGDRIVWELIKDFKSLGFEEFDFGGIFNNTGDPAKKNVNIFKERWGGQKVPTRPNLSRFPKLT